MYIVDMAPSPGLSNTSGILSLPRILTGSVLSLALSVLTWRQEPPTHPCPLTCPLPAKQLLEASRAYEIVLKICVGCPMLLNKICYPYSRNQGPRRPDPCPFLQSLHHSYCNNSLLCPSQAVYCRSPETCTRCSF